jgi:Helicase HerA-like C-terminal
VQIPLAMTNRHGSIAAATGTVETATVVLTEQLADAGVAVVSADMKGVFGIPKLG